MKITAPAMMLATTLFLANQECESQSLIVNAADLIYHPDINFVGAQSNYINTMPGANNANGDYEQTSSVKYNNQNLMTIKWSDIANSNTIAINKVDLYHVPGQNIHINLVIPGAFAASAQHYNAPKQIQIKENAFANIGAAGVTLDVAFQYPHFSNYSVLFANNCSRMFANSSSITSIDFSAADTYSVANMESMFEGCDNLRELRLDNFSMWHCNNSQNMFLACSSLVTLRWGTAAVNLPTGPSYDPETTLLQVFSLLDLGS